MVGSRTSSIMRGADAATEEVDPVVWNDPWAKTLRTTAGTEAVTLFGAPSAAIEVGAVPKKRHRLCHFWSTVLAATSPLQAWG